MVCEKLGTSCEGQIVEIQRSGVLVEHIGSRISIQKSNTRCPKMSCWRGHGLFNAFMLLSLTFRRGTCNLHSSTHVMPAAAP